ncbi:sensor histidine kinase [Pedobacter flavus]|uniref:Sensor histidine kinase n=1 Tax=Pedobacter flavus TaxID=3113906 RepID=A0ABU7GZI9_9SPHI|nr:sensor histidine kinase [Pedobacter sp. VNH31]MEE1884237.1 sensor histidine kinase [Pedobacter sp. VNH31]
MKFKGAILIHILFWSLIGIPYFIGLWRDMELTLRNVFLQVAYPSVIALSTFYINYFILIPQLIKKQSKYLLYLLSLFLLLVIVVGVKMGFLYMFHDILNLEPDGRFKENQVLYYFIFSVFITGFLLVFSLLLKLTIDWFSNERVQRNLETEKREMELQFLKSQLNPHFLFNSLNNIYSLAYQKSDKTAGAILKLSEIMRYMIYESNDRMSDLSKEVEYLQSYIDLHKLRFKDGGAIKLTINGEISGQQIVPLILISFIENAFKHGVANDPEDPILINIIANQKILHFSVKNKKNKDNYKDKVGGVGLSNVERRLQLMYPDRYKLNIVNSATHYTTELMLDL